MSLEGGMDGAIGQPFVRFFHAVKFQLPVGDLNLIDCSAFVEFSINGSNVIFNALDSTYGTISSVSQISESIATEAPSFKVILLPPTPTGVAAISDPTFQGSKVYVWMGILDEATGSVIGSPELIWYGRLDTVKTSDIGQIRSCEVNIVSGFDRLFISSEGNRLNDRAHKAVWPGEDCLAFNIEALSAPLWGAEGAAAVPAQTTLSPAQTQAGLSQIAQQTLNQYI